jgi:hypothetical protein
MFAWSVTPDIRHFQLAARCGCVGFRAGLHVEVSLPIAREHKVA